METTQVKSDGKALVNAIPVDHHTGEGIAFWGYCHATPVYMAKDSDDIRFWFFVFEDARQAAHWLAVAKFDTIYKVEPQQITTIRTPDSETALPVEGREMEYQKRYIEQNGIGDWQTIDRAEALRTLAKGYYDPAAALEFVNGCNHPVRANQFCEIRIRPAHETALPQTRTLRREEGGDMLFA